MCKIAMMPGVKQKKIGNAWKLAKALAPRMSNGNPHGFGYAAVKENGDLFGERWHNNDQAFKLKPNNDKDNEIRSGLSKFLTPIEAYSSFGEIDYKNITTLILHARFATCERSLSNVHPFVYTNPYDSSKVMALIHNGVISNSYTLMRDYDPDNERSSTCDSESILFGYERHEVNLNIDNMKLLGNDLSGYYACAVLAKTFDNIPIIDIFKSKNASLYCTYVNQLGCVVYCTSRFDLEEAIKECGYTNRTMYEVNPEVVQRFNSVTGENMQIADFKERGYTYYGGSNRQTVYDRKDTWEGFEEWEKKKNDPVKTLKDSVSTEHSTLTSVKYDAGKKEDMEDMEEITERLNESAKSKFHNEGGKIIDMTKVTNDKTIEALLNEQEEKVSNK